MSLMQRLETGFALAIVFMLIFATNRMDEQHFKQVQDTLNTVFEDRVLAQDYIYRIENLIHQESLRLAVGNLEVPAQEDEDLEALLQKFAVTKLTMAERRHFESLLADSEKLRAVKGANIPTEEKVVQLQHSITRMDKALDQLAKVQVEESQRLTNIAQMSLDSTDLTSKVEIGFLIVIGVMLQLLVFLRPWSGRDKGAAESR